MVYADAFYVIMVYADAVYIDEVCWYVNCARTTAFIFDTQAYVLVKVLKFLSQKMSLPEKDSNPNLRIHAECSNHFSYEG